MIENRLSEHLVFGLDIGTRSIVGSVGYMERNKFNVVAHYVKEHESRDMLDGQIHDIGRVSESIKKVKKELENQLDLKLNDVCIAAAGRVLRTVTVHVEVEFDEETQITGEQIYSLDLMGVEKAYGEINSNSEGIKFYSVGYTVIKYYLNDYVIVNLEGHKARKISADILATFLPEDVVDGLYTAVEGAGLTVANLTLEPIAAINIAIPESYRLLNIALVDVGAGTSDISITKDGSIIAYGMIAHAGDEFTEVLVSKYLVDFNTAEKIKVASTKNRQITFTDIMGLKKKISPKEVREAYAQCVEKVANEVADKIIELNGGKSVSAVFVVGGGGKINGFTSCIAKRLDIPDERVALRGEEVLGAVEFKQEDIKKDPLLVTPIGICMNFYSQKNNFIFVHVNDERIKLYDNNHLTVIDAAMQVGLANDALFARRGKAVNYTLNGESRMARGELGESAVIKVNDKDANINTPIKKNDYVSIVESSYGEEACMYIRQIPEYKGELTVMVNGSKVVCPKFASVNGELKPEDYRICEGDSIEILDYYTVEQLIMFLDVDTTGKDILVNNRIADMSEKVFENFSVDIEDTDYVADTSEGETKAVTGEKEEKTDKPEEKAEDGEEKSNTEGVTQGTGNEYNKSEKTGKSRRNKTIRVTVNGDSVVLKNKRDYIFVDIFDFYPFDTKTAAGVSLVVKANGVKCEFTQPIFDGDSLEIYWED